MLDKIDSLPLMPPVLILPTRRCQNTVDASPGPAAVAKSMHTLVIETYQLTLAAGTLETLQTTFIEGGITEGTVTIGRSTSAPGNFYMLWWQKEAVPVAREFPPSAFQPAVAKEAADTFVAYWRNRIR